jgi:hypothetical protein
LLFLGLSTPFPIGLTLQFSGERFKDLWAHKPHILGVDPGIIPLTDTTNQVIKIWTTGAIIPSRKFEDLDWSYAQAHQGRSGRARAHPGATFRGLFERLHGLRALNASWKTLSVPDACEELFDAYTDWKMKS